MSRPSDLPDFKHPPLVEVLLSIQFEALSQFRTVHSGRLADLWAADFPTVEEVPPLNPDFEIFGVFPARPQEFHFQLIEALPQPRYQFIKSDKTEIIQFQRDRIVHNWRKVGDDEYPRYENIREKFLSEIEHVDKVLEKSNLGFIKPNLCEITYINNIEFIDGRPLSQVFNFVGMTGLSGEPEQAVSTFRYKIQNLANEPIGRFTVDMRPALDNLGKLVTQFTLSARGRPAEPTCEAAAQFLDVGRIQIVQAFASMTTPEMHKLWERQK